MASGLRHDAAARRLHAERCDFAVFSQSISALARRELPSPRLYNLAAAGQPTGGVSERAQE
jgi:hypothetical protein